MRCPRTALAAATALALTLAPGARALPPEKAVTQYVRESWQTEDGLPQNTVQAIVQTRDGYLWLGTQEGLVRFDGVRFQAFDRSGTPALGSNNVQALHEDAAGTLWIGTEGGGLVARRGEAFTAYGSKDGLPSAAVRDLEGAAGGALYAAAYGGGVCRVENGRLTTLSAAEGLTSNRVSALAAGEDGALYVGTYDQGLFLARGGRASPVPLGPGREAASIFALLADRAGDLWIAARGGLLRLSHGEVRAFTSGDGLPEDTYSCLLEDRDGNLWIGTGGSGLYRLAPGAARADRLSAEEGLTDRRIRSLFEDREGSVWIGTEGGGLNRLRNGKLTPIGTREGLTDRMTYGVAEGPDGSIWVGTRSGGLNRVRDGKVTAFTKADGLASDTVQAVLVRGNGEVWAGTEGGGVCRLSGERFTCQGTRAGFPADSVFALAEDASGTLWAGTGGAGAVRLVDGRWSGVPTPSPAGAGPRVVFAILPARDGTVWLGTYGQGLLGIREAGEPLRFGPAEGAAFGAGLETVLSLSEGADGSLWIGTLGGGLGRLKDGRLRVFRAADGLFNDLIYAAVEDGLGNLFLSCNKGIFSVRLDELDRLASGQIPKVESTVYSRADGMRSAECNGAFQPAGLRTRAGRLLFPTIDGLATIDPARIPRNRLPPPVAIESFTSDGTPYPAGGPVVVPPGRHRLEVRYTGLSLLAPERVRFRVQLLGFDGEPLDVGTRRETAYTNVPPGRYTLHVSACNDDGVWNEAGASLGIELRPHFWQTRLFVLAWVLLAGLLAWGVYALRVRRIRAEFAMILRERSRMAREIHDTLSQGLTGAVLQMDSAGEVLEESPEKARAFLARARQLARGSLGEAKRSIWALRSEALEAHDLPRALSEMAAQMSAGRPVNVELHVTGDPKNLPHDVEGELFRIAQEALANAFKYAGPTRIRIEVGRVQEEIWVSVTDDGRGFDPASVAPAAGGGFGLPGMRERARRLSGSLEVWSEPGKGTRITARFPVSGA